MTSVQQAYLKYTCNRHKFTLEKMLSFNSYTKHKFTSVRQKIKTRIVCERPFFVLYADKLPGVATFLYDKRCSFEKMFCKHTVKKDLWQYFLVIALLE